MEKGYLLVPWQWHCSLRGPASVGLGLLPLSLRVFLPGQTETLPPTQPFVRVVKPSKSRQSGWGSRLCGWFSCHRAPRGFTL